MSDLSRLSLSELEQLQKSIQSELSKRRAQEEQRLVDEIKQKAALLGLSHQQLLENLQKAGVKNAGGGKKLFRHPQTRQEWTGRGRKPGWVQEWLKQGRSLDELRVA